MISKPSQLILELSKLLELDELTIKEQIWPQLSTMKSSFEVIEYFEGLLGNSNAAKQFISSYTNSRFPNTTTSTSTTLPPPPQSNSNWSKSNANNNNRSNVSNSNNRGHQTNNPQQLNQMELQRRVALEREFEGSGGKVYLKNRDEEFSLGGGGGGGKKSRGVSPSGSGSVTPIYPSTSSSSSSSQVQNPFPISRLNPALMKATAAIQPLISSNSSNRKGGAPKEEEGLVPLSEKATLELIEIDRVLRTFEKGKGPVRECLCQARIHPLSRHTQICPRCALAICELNLPISPCPSCLYTPLLSSTSAISFITSLKSQRDLIIQSETLRIAREKVQIAAEKAAIRFPTLSAGGGGDGMGGARNAGSGVGGIRNYSNIAGAGPDLNERIDIAYREGVSLNGRNFGGNNSVSKITTTGNTGGRVLKLDMKTKKVKIQTKVVKKISKVVNQSEGVVSVDAEDEYDDDDDVDGLGAGWYDEKDDGYLARNSTLIEQQQQEKLELVPRDRPFLNITLDENSRPIWQEEIIAEKEKEVFVVNSAVGVSKGVPGAAKIEGDGKVGEGKKKVRSKVKKGTGVV